MSDQPIKYFTLEEAKEALPYVRRIVEDIVAEYGCWRTGISQYEIIGQEAGGEGAESDDQARLRQEVDEVARRMNSYIDELSSVGCVFKGFDDGLVDFRSRREGRDIFLCWKLGEADVTHWHELNAGFASRQVLIPELVRGDADT